MTQTGKVPNRGRTKELSGAAPGDQRTPAKTIGEVKYAASDRQQPRAKQGGAGASKANKDAQQSALEGPAAYAPHDPEEAKLSDRKKRQPR
jgi:hypothetical protein